ncbi:cell surface Cu-only superoxide dismutase 5 [[Candida] jaroonii]|uniref:Cell surface Cu-only superoxide dismutase 5 n=1 Tax=[Candida] jaroonii TaxID=467808 RepID=A0ACA9YBW2_9ASCO|nr:cell surface Cu-only superoxide dismutase 5 [[Candida] jaroonii]
MLTKLSTLVSVFSVGSIAAIQPLANDSPQTQYVAIFDGKLEGNVTFTGLNNGSIEVGVDLDGFPSEGGPFMYHVHEAPVPSDGNCTGTKGHLNPYGGNIKSNNTDEKEIGDLSGRYGTLEGTTKISYVDQYLSLNPDSEAYIGNLSVVVHLADNVRYACANISKVDSDKDGSSGNNSNGSVPDYGSDSGRISLTGISLVCGVAAALLI